MVSDFQQSKSSFLEEIIYAKNISLFIIMNIVEV